MDKNRTNHNHKSQHSFKKDSEQSPLKKNANDKNEGQSSIGAELSRPKSVVEPQSIGKNNAISPNSHGMTYPACFGSPTYQNTNQEEEQQSRQKELSSHKPSAFDPVKGIGSSSPEKTSSNWVKPTQKTGFSSSQGKSFDSKANTSYGNSKSDISQRGAFEGSNEDKRSREEDSKTQGRIKNGPSLGSGPHYYSDNNGQKSINEGEVEDILRGINFSNSSIGSYDFSLSNSSSRLRAALSPRPAVKHDKGSKG